jgi:phage antirepressor YoqD-like protein
MSMLSPPVLIHLNRVAAALGVKPRQAREFLLKHNAGWKLGAAKQAPVYTSPGRLREAFGAFGDEIANHVARQ